MKQITNIISGFHHEIHNYKNNFVILSKEGGIKLVDGRTLQSIWEERLDGQLLSYSLIHNDIFYGSTTDTFLYSFDLDRGELLEKGQKNIFFNSRSHKGGFVLAKSYSNNNGNPRRLLGLFNLREFKFVFTKELKTGRIFELLDNKILHAGIGRDFEVNCMDLHGNQMWTSNLRTITKDEAINRVRFIGEYNDTLVFAAESEKDNHFISLRHENGDEMYHVTNSQTGLRETANYFSFLNKGFAYTLTKNLAISLNLETLEVNSNTDQSLDVLQAIYEEGRLFYLSNERGKIGEYSFDKDASLWTLMLNEDSNILGVRCINNILFAYDIEGILYKLE